MREYYVWKNQRGKVTVSETDKKYVAWLTDNGYEIIGKIESELKLHQLKEIFNSNLI